MTDLLDVVVTSVIEVAEGIRGFELRHPRGEALPAFSAGAHIDVHLPGGGIRSYSLHNDDAERDRYCIAVKREPAGRGGSAALHDQVWIERRLQIGAPRNAFALNRDANHSLLIAGGIGITPLLAMARVLHREGRSFELHYASRSPRHTAFRDEIVTGAFGGRAVFYCREDRDAPRLNASRLAALALSGTHVYLCGPPSLVTAVSEAFAGRRDVTLHTEYFAAPVALQPAAEHGSFQVRLQRSGQTFEVGPDQTILEVLRDNGVEVETSCESGVCGTCLTRIVAGQPDHQDYFLSQDQKDACDCILVCVSRAALGSLLVLNA